MFLNAIPESLRRRGASYLVARPAPNSKLTSAVFRALKSDLAIRPICHLTPKRVEAHIMVAFWDTVCGCVLS
jgi:hypothetical protein